MTELGHSVTMLTGTMDPNRTEEDYGPNFGVHYLAGVPANELGDAYWRVSAAKFDILHDRNGPFDLVIGRGATVWGFLRFSKNAENVPIILHEGTYPRWLFSVESHAGWLSGIAGYLFAPAYAFRQRRLAMSMQRAVRVVCITPALAQGLRRAFWWHPPRTLALTYGFDMSSYYPREPGPALPPRLVSLGRMALNKGVLAMIEVLAGLANRSAVLEAMGPAAPEIRQTVLDHAARLGVADRYFAPGPVQHEDLPDRLAGASAFLFPSTHAEGLGKVVLEAMAAGVPVVAYRQQVLEGIIEDGVTGFLVPIRNVEAMIDRVDRLLADPVLGAKMGAAARKKIETEFSPQAINAQWQALLAEVVAEAAARRA